MAAGEVEPPRRGRDLFSVVKLIPESYVARFDLNKIFGRAAPLHVDLGCGDGAFLVALAERNPEKNFLGIDRLAGRVAKACRKAAMVSNVRVLRGESSNAVRYLLPKSSVECFYLFFPDPWPKRRHQRRRIVTADFLKLIHAALEENGIFRVATDQTDYFNHMRKVLAESDLFAPTQANIDNHLPASTFEERFKCEGAVVYRLELKKVSPVM